MKPTDFALIVADARREVQKALESDDREAIKSFAPPLILMLVA